MIRQAQPGEEASIEAFLARHPNSSMFLRSNLAAHGLGDRQQALATNYLLDLEDTGAIRGVFGRSNEGFLMCQCPEADSATWERFSQMLNGQVMQGITGDSDQVEAALRFFTPALAEFSINHAEPLYRLELDALAPSKAKLRSPTPFDVELLTFWFAAYARETGVQKSGDAGKIAVSRAVSAITSGKTRLLLEGDRPVAMSSFNATIPGMVQIGGVYTPPELRGRGHARTVVAGQLREARGEGVQVALLFSNNDAASRAYEAIGFQHVGSYRVAVLKTPLEIGGA